MLALFVPALSMAIDRRVKHNHFLYFLTTCPLPRLILNNSSTTAQQQQGKMRRLVTSVFFPLILDIKFVGSTSLVGEKPDKELPGIVGVRGDTV